MAKEAMNDFEKAAEDVAAYYAEHPEAIDKLRGLDNGMLVYDKMDRPVILVNNEWALNWILQRNPGIEFLTVPSDKARV